MPNWVYNRLSIEGIETEEEVDEIIETLSIDGKFTFESLIPSPSWVYKANCSGDDSEDFTTWYEWNRANWGTKWDVDNDCVKVQYDGLLTIDFETAWSPPMPFIVSIANTILHKRKLSMMHDYIDEGEMFHSRQRWEGNERVSKSSTDEDLKRLRVVLRLEYDDVEEYYEYDG